MSLALFSLSYPQKAELLFIKRISVSFLPGVFRSIPLTSNFKCCKWKVLCLIPTATPLYRGTYSFCLENVSIDTSVFLGVSFLINPAWNSVTLQSQDLGVSSLSFVYYCSLLSVTFFFLFSFSLLKLLPH